MHHLELVAYFEMQHTSEMTTGLCQCCGGRSGFAEMTVTNMNLQGGKWQRELDVAVEAALAAGAIIKQGFQNKKKAVEEKKNASDLVTETDVKVSMCVQRCLFASSCRTTDSSLPAE